MKKATLTILLLTLLALGAMVAVPSAPDIGAAWPSNSTLTGPRSIRSPANMRRCSPSFSRFWPMKVPFLLSRSSISQACPRSPLLVRLRSRRACSPESALNGRVSSRSDRRPIRISSTLSSNSTIRSVVGICSSLGFSSARGSTRSRSGMGKPPVTVSQVASIAWGAGELCSPRPIAGGFGNPLRVPESK